jgi:Domain of unknown function (DUF4956)
MPDWLRDAFQGGTQVAPALVAARVVLALLFGFVVAGVSVVCLPRRQSDTSALATTLVLLCILTALVTMVIGDNTARAFGLVGALSIVRFRTVVEDTRDTAFVIFAVVVGMAAGAGYALMAAVGIVSVTVAAFLMRRVSMARVPEPTSAILHVRIGLGHNPDELLNTAFAHHLAEVRLAGAATARQGAALELTYAVRLKQPAGIVELVAALNRIEGVQSVELRRQ